MQKPIPTHPSRPSGARRLATLFGLFVIALILAACGGPTTPPTPNFTLSFSGNGSQDGTVEIEQGESLEVTVDVNASGGFDGQVTLSSGVQAAQASGITVTFADDTVTDSTTMTIEVGAGVNANRDYEITVTGTSGGLTRTATLTVDVTEDTTPGGSFDLTPSSNSVVVSAGASADVTISVAPTGGFSDDVDLSFSGSNGITGSFNPATVTGADGDSVLTISVPGGLAAGTYDVTVTGDAGAESDSVNISVVVIDGSTLFVDPSGDDGTGDGTAGNPFATITQALTVVADGGTIFVNDGTYDSETFPITIAGNVTIQGESEAGTVIDNGSSATDVIYIDGSAGGSLTISNLTIEGGSDGIQIAGAADLDASNITIRDFGDRALHMNGAGSSSVTVDGGTFTAGAGTGSDIVEVNNTGVTLSLSNVDIDGSASTDPSPEGIDVKEAVAVTLDNVTVANVPDGGIEIDNTVSGASTFTMSNSSITGSGGVGLTISSDLTSIDVGTNNVISGSGGFGLYDDRAGGAATVVDATGLRINGTDIADGSVTGPATSGTRYKIENNTTIDFGS